MRPTTGGVPVREIGGVGRLMEGLSHEEKKSSSASPEGVAEPSTVPSLMTTSLGYLHSSRLAGFARDQEKKERKEGRKIMGDDSMEDDDELLGITSSPALELVLVFRRRGRLVFGLGVFAVQGCSSAILLEELGGRFIATNLHNAQLIPLPFCSSISQTRPSCRA